MELYREFMGDIPEEIERENKIINDLLSLVKMDKTAHDMNIETLDINQIGGTDIKETSSDCAEAEYRSCI